MYSNTAGKYSQIKMLLKHKKYSENYSKNDRKTLKKTVNSFLIDQVLYYFSVLWLCSAETKLYLD